MGILFQEELTTKVLFNRIRKDIKEFQLEKAIDSLDKLNNTRKKVLTKCDLAFQYNKRQKF